MAEKASRDGTTRRQTFRKTLAEAGLPHEYLDALEQKRKQLDESIHKYIAAKERDYKQFERDLRQEYKLVQDKDSGKVRRTSSESTQETHESPRLLGKQQSSAVDALLAAGVQRNHIGQPLAVAVVDDDGTAPIIETRSIAGLTDRRASFERDKAFVGVFTPAFLPALEKGETSPERQPERASSAPPIRNALEHIQETDQNAMQRSKSDGFEQAKPKRPVQLQLNHRTSSSGSSADGRLASALKSPTHPNQPKRKRVSLAVGDTIVAPSDNVPATKSNNNTPSHSWTRSPLHDRETPKAVSVPREPTHTEPQAPSPFSSHGEHGNINGTLVESESAKQERLNAINATPDILPAPSLPTSTISKSRSKIDADGDLFDLEDEDEAPHGDVGTELEDAAESEDDITGRVDQNALRAISGAIYDPNAGLIPEEEEPPDDDDHAEHLEFMPGSAVASQQPTHPGFRRPSVSYDPVYRGANYDRAEHGAVANEIYGSSFTRPAKGSFTTGSLGESFMARNAEQIMRNRAIQEQPEVRS